jgi:hypothetical protein
VFGAKLHEFGVLKPAVVNIGGDLGAERGGNIGPYGSKMGFSGWFIHRDNFWRFFLAVLGARTLFWAETKWGKFHALRN